MVRANVQNVELFCCLLLPSFFSPSFRPGLLERLSASPGWFFLHQRTRPTPLTPHGNA